MTLRSTRLLIVFLSLLSTFQTAFGTEGIFLVRTTKGVLESRPAVITFPKDFQGDLLLNLAGAKLKTNYYGWTKVNGKLVMGVLFTNLPNTKDPVSVLALKGAYVEGERFSGELFTIPASSGKLDAVALTKSLIHDVTDAKFQHKGIFYFTSGKVGGQGKGISVQPLSLDRNNPCPYGPCMSNGGVGRYMEYYAGGPIQNPGRPSTAASFERGVPYGWTRQAQMQAQAIGNGKTRVFYEHIDRYARPFFGFWGLPWMWW